MGILADSWTIWMPQDSELLDNLGKREDRAADALGEEEEASSKEATSEGGEGAEGTTSRQPSFTI